MPFDESGSILHVKMRRGTETDTVCLVTQVALCVSSDSYRNLLQCKGVPTYCGVNIVSCSGIDNCTHFDGFFSSKVMGSMTIPRSCPQIPLAVTTSGANVAWGQCTSTHHHALQSSTPDLFSLSISWLN